MFSKHIIIAIYTVYTWVYFDFIQVPLQNLRPSFHVGSGDSDLHVKASRPDQGAAGQENQSRRINYRFGSLILKALFRAGFVNWRTAVGRYRPSESISTDPIEYLKNKCSGDDAKKKRP